MGDYLFNNRGQPFRFTDFWCGDKNTAVLYDYDLISVDFISEQKRKAKIIKLEKYFIELKYKSSSDDGVMIKRISVQSSEKRKAMEICDFLNKRLCKLQKKARQFCD